MDSIPSKTKRKKILVFLICLIFGFVAGAAAFVAYKQYIVKEPLDLTIFPKKTTPAETTTNLLEGTQTDKTLAGRHPLAIIIENHPAARPQIGLDKASIIYEAITEGGITRFMAIYGPRDADKIGPVRSLRTFFLDWSHEYQAFLAHVGGNIDALDRVPQEGTLDLDQFAIGDKAYWREPQAGKAIEHTMFTSTTKLYNVAKGKGWDMQADFTPLKFIEAKNASINQNLNQKVTIDFSSLSYKVVYDYNPINDNYLRSLGGFPHKDRDTGNQLAPTNIIIQSVGRAHTLTRINEESWTFTTQGEGKAMVFYGGQKIEATWKKQDLKTRTKFYDSAGNEIRFLPGQFWYEIVPPDIFDKVKTETTTNENSSSNPS